ncbi:MAG: PLP-dependent cysteine synthase family protein [Halococcoides sp.]
MNDSILETIGSPLVRIDAPTNTTIAAKLDGFNPGGSAKDRPARAMIAAAEREGVLEAGDRIVEPTSGNTGIGIALVGAASGYDVTIVMPASKSAERRRLMRAYGADLELVEGSISDARDRAAAIADQSGVVTLDQFENSANPQAHEETTARELLDQVGDRSIDAIVVAVGTGGTLSGLARGLQAGGHDPLVVAVEPETNAVLSGEEPGDDDFQGMGPGFVSPNLDVEAIDRVERVGIDLAERECRRLAVEEGILVGQSSGAASLAAERIARAYVDGDLEPDGEPLVVTVFPDDGERYLSTGLFDPDE